MKSQKSNISVRIENVYIIINHKKNRFILAKTLIGMHQCDTQDSSLSEINYINHSKLTLAKSLETLQMLNLQNCHCSV